MMCAGALAPERLSALARLCVAGLGFLSMAVCVACLRTVVFFVYWCALLSAARADVVLWTVPWPLPWGRLSRFLRWASLLFAVLGRGRVGPGLCFVGSESPYTRAQIGLRACLHACSSNVNTIIVITMLASRSCISRFPTPSPMVCHAFQLVLCLSPNYSTSDLLCGVIQFLSWPPRSGGAHRRNNYNLLVIRRLLAQKRKRLHTPQTLAVPQFSAAWKDCHDKQMQLRMVSDAFLSALQQVEGRQKKTPPSEMSKLALRAFDGRMPPLPVKVDDLAKEVGLTRFQVIQKLHRLAYMAWLNMWSQRRLATDAFCTGFGSRSTREDREHNRE